MTRRSMTLPMLPNLTEYVMVASVRSNHAGAQALIQLLRSLVASVTVHLCSWQHSFRFWETSPASMFSHCHPSRLLPLSQRHQPITPYHPHVRMPSLRSNSHLISSHWCLLIGCAVLPVQSKVVSGSFRSSVHSGKLVSRTRGPILLQRSSTLTSSRLFCIMVSGFQQTAVLCLFYCTTIGHFQFLNKLSH